LYKILAKNSIVGQRLIFMPSCHSTNDICADLISKGDIVNGTVVITDHQHQGRGQGSNAWISEKESNLTMSVILDTSFMNVKDQYYLNMMVCLAVSDMLREYAGKDISIKWPNDIYYLDKKICGILIQNILKGNKMEYSIVGLGININQEEFTIENAVSLRNITGRWYDMNEVLNRLVELLEEYYKILRLGLNKRLKGLYMERLMWFNEDRFFETDHVFEGRITDVDPHGRLIINAEDQLFSFSFQEVKFVR